MRRQKLSIWEILAVVVAFSWVILYFVLHAFIVIAATLIPTIAYFALDLQFSKMGWHHRDSKQMFVYVTNIVLVVVTAVVWVLLYLNYWHIDDGILSAASRGKADIQSLAPGASHDAPKPTANGTWNVLLNQLNGVVGRATGQQ